MARSLFTTATLAALTAVATAASADEWALQSVYQVMTDRFARPTDFKGPECDNLKYCGGTYAGIISKLDYIQDMGFTAIFISPTSQNIEDDTGFGEAYHGYWPNDLYANNEHFGTAGDLSHLSQELHGRGMKLMVDVVVNDMAQKIDGKMPKPIDYSKMLPYNDEKYYHPYCNITDYANRTLAQNCWLGVDSVALADLDTKNEDVIRMTNDWIKSLVANYSIDGLRIDAAKHVDDDFLPSFSKAAGVYTLGEVYTGEIDDLCYYQKNKLLTGLNNYAVYFPAIRAFTAGKMKDLSKMIEDLPSGCSDVHSMGVFTENHDLARFATQNPDMALASNALFFTILADGIPFVYQGQEQHMKGAFSPDNRDPLWPTNYNTDAPLYKLVATANTLRNHAIKVDSTYATNHSTQLYVDDSTMATRKGPNGVQIVTVFSNQGEKGGAYDLQVAGGFDPNTEVMEIMTCEKQTANTAGNITVKMDKGAPRAFFPTANLKGSGLCGSEKSSQAGGNSTGNSSSSGKKSGAAPQGALRTSTLALGVVFVIAFWWL